jgi:SAM-dependent methyltransferase
MTCGLDHTARFTDRVAYYAGYRPRYPDVVMDLLRYDAGLDPNAVVVDVGSGTGLSADLFLRHGHTVCAVEPNANMRDAAEKWLLGRRGFVSVDGTAERTPLPDGCADAVVAASAFHWFDATVAREEFARILKPGGLAIVMGNGRRKHSTPFMRSYDDVVRKFSEPTPAHRNRDERVRAFLGDGVCTSRIEYTERLDFAELNGRTLSYSTAPLPGTLRHTDFLRELRIVFDTAAEEGRVCYDGEVVVYWARWPPRI